MIAPPISQRGIAQHAPHFAHQRGREGKGAALTAVSMGSRNAIAASQQLSSPTPERRVRR